MEARISADSIRSANVATRSQVVVIERPTVKVEKVQITREAAKSAFKKASETVFKTR